MSNSDKHESLSVQDNLSSASKNVRRGVFFAMISYFLWATNFTQVKFLEKHFFPSFNQFYFVALRSTGTFLVSYFNLKGKKIPIMSITELKLKWHFLFRVTSNFIAFVCLIQMFYYLRIGTATCISGAHPLAVMLFAVCILNDPMHFRYIAGLLISIGGTYIIVSKDNNSTQDYQSENGTLLGIFFGVLHVSFVGLKLCINKLLVDNKVDNDLNSAWVGITNGILAVICMVIAGNYDHLLDWQFIVLGLINGPVFYFAYLTLNLAYSDISPNSAAALSYSVTVMCFISGLVFFGESIYYTDFIGCGLIMAFNMYHIYFPIK